MVLLESENLEMGSEALDFELKASDDSSYSLSDFSEAKVLVIVFMCNHCPYVQAIWSRLVALQDRFEDAGVQFVGINPNLNPDYPEETLEKMKDYYEEYEMNFPYLIDETQEVAKAYEAQCTPDIYLYDEDRKLAYHGRVDDNWKDESAVTNEELAEAIQLVLRGESVADQRPSIGCSIKWRDE